MKRRVRSCVFCNRPIVGTNGAREHILPRWLLKRLGLDKDFVQGLHSGIPWGKATIDTRIQSFSSLVFGLVCSRCNNGWMSQLEAAAKPVLTGLMSESVDSVTLDERAMTLLARWAFKTSAMLNLASNYRQIVPGLHLREFYQTERPPEVAVVDLALGPVEIEHLWMQGAFGLIEIADTRELTQSLVEALASLYVIALNIGGVLFRVAACPIESCEVLLPDNVQAVRLWPMLAPSPQVTLSRGTADVGDFYISTKLRIT